MDYPLIAARIFNTPLLIRPEKLQAILSALGPKLGFSVEMPQPEMFRAPRNASFNQDGQYRVEGSVGIIEINGTLVNKGAWLGSYSGMVSYEGIAHQLETALDDSSVHTIMLNINSFGGEAAGLFDLTDFIYESRSSKRIVSLVAEYADSAAYGIAAATEKIFITQTGEAGSIGVVITHAEYSEMLANEGVGITHIFAGEHKTLGSPYKPLNDADQKMLQSGVDDLYKIFVDKVASYRGMDRNLIVETEARCYMGPSAIEAGLADEIITGRELLQRLQEDPPTTGAPSRQSLNAKGTTMKDKLDTGLDAKKTPAASAEDEESVFTAATHAAAVKSAAAKATTAERERIKTILSSDHATGRLEMAHHLAFESDMDAESAVTMLEKAPTGLSGGGLAAAMADSEKPEVGALAEDDEDSAATVAKRIASYK